ncbi:MAG TPA: PorP/SprF family type IX secretion system membrane protein [Saprospiraceae bacterium]|nr:PorP/SprF family type IX secretion system membrane protein [Saprospiraceae bacterium]HMX87635.1 PorP/SprF family type IX secretion system membrane protein [Saprospiraceae bacterium]HMZ39450.1 PorP/SprF family type IX secretion system membrane protein [Saprospiraceae bacterium]HNA63236.1 PorP/SprF family type IX secretion system membrane protein [Saprospiraceae bacterium]HNC35099.1 PorP/SprF family type IX secretion system membrane protein [Saprospiraceae bacterium]
MINRNIKAYAMKKLIYIFRNIGVLVFFGSVLHAQDYATSLKTPAVYTQYHINPILINPAYTGFEGQSQILFNFRNHWAGFDGSPKGLTLGINGSPVNNMGLGGIIYSEKFGVANRFSGQLNYAYNFKTGPDTKMSLGLSGSYIRYSLDNSAFTDPNHNQGDPVINKAIDGENYFAADLGYWAEFANKYRLGITLPHVVLANLGNTASDSTKPFNLIAFLGARWNVPSYRLVLEPSVCVRKISDVPFGTDLNVLAKLLEDRLFLGFTYSFGPSDNRTSFLGGVRVNQFKFIYSYDQTYQTFQTFSRGSHELTLSFDLGRSSKKMEDTKNMMEEKSMDQK